MARCLTEADLGEPNAPANRQPIYVEIAAGSITSPAFIIAKRPKQKTGVHGTRL